MTLCDLTFGTWLLSHAVGLSLIFAGVAVFGLCLYLTFKWTE
jgi:hypothetical protein